ncbi:hypothetical protein A3Q56_07537 [Intoshia linei]|uniref:Uncharacterized protein n=1 Tax=Intoshia linei TaxID=1819745 RepID=A0A177ARU8_9BILA|nr:hypothetical protein A3Q56_07537 [Intoshia linei]
MTINSNIDRKLYIFKFLYISINLKNGYTNNMSDDEIEENITMFTIQYTIVMKILTKIDIKNVSQTMDIEVEEFILVLQTCQQVAYSIWNLISHSDCIQSNYYHKYLCSIRSKAAKLENICTKNCKLLKELLHLNDKVENIDEHHYTMIQLLYKTLKSFLGVKVNGINLNIYDTENLINQVETMNLINNS